VRSGNFEQFDYGEEENMIRYGQSKPALYDMEAMAANIENIPILLFRGAVDWLVADKDFAYMEAFFPESTKIVEVADFNHLDLMWGTDDNIWVAEDVFKFLETL